MPATALIGGQLRHLAAWKPSYLKVQGVKPPVELAALRMEHTIANFPTDYDQGALGSCGPNSLAELYQHDLKDRYSRLFAYFFTRATEGDFLDDDGVTIPDLLSVAQTMGMPLERLWPYDIDKFQVAPPLGTLIEAVKARIEGVDIVVDLAHLLFELDNEQPVIMGFYVPASMQDNAGEDSTAATGIVRVPSATDPKIGGHCVVAIGFDREKQLVRCTCHYGPDFGDKGTIWLPFGHWAAGNVMDMRAVRRIA